MFRPAARRLTTFSPSTTLLLQQQGVRPARRLISTAPPARKSRSWKSLAARWALAVGGVYYYNTSNIFAESAIEAYPPSPDYQQAEAEPSTIEAITERKRQVKAAAEAEQQNLARSQAVSAEEDSEPPRTPQEYEDEAGQQGAFNPETGEINWDCPCLGGMAHGPCGENFREAFSCFVFSKEEPKGMDCIDKFKGMQDCFRRFPEVYGSELDEDEEGQAEEENANEKAMEAGSPSTLPPPPSSTTTQSSKPSPTQKAGRGGEKVTHVTSNDTPAPEDAISEKRHRAVEATQQVKELGGQDESPALVPKSAHDEASTSDGR